MDDKTDLLREYEVADWFKDARSRSDDAIIAVPYWGKGASTTLALEGGAPLRIICNLDQPGCNPDVIEELLQLGLRVRTHSRLHAKIYATREVAIVGSSNVSTNGLTVEGPSSRGWVEANVRCSDPAFVDDVWTLFETLWESTESRKVTLDDIKAARRARAALPPTLFDVPRGRALFDAVREKPDAFRNVFVAAYESDLSADAKCRLRELQ